MVIAAAAAPANSTGVSRASFANMILVYHENDERDSSVLDGAVAAFVFLLFGCRTTGLPGHGVNERQP
jgi:hypothetical protein